MRKPAAIIEIRGSNTVRYFRRTLRRMGATWSAKSHSAVEEGGPAAASPSPRRQRPPPCSAVDTVEFDAPLEAEITDIWIVAGTYAAGLGAICKCCGLYFGYERCGASTCATRVRSRQALNGITSIFIFAGQSNAVGENAPDKQAIPDRAKAWPSKILAFGPDGRCVPRQRVALATSF